MIENHSLEFSHGSSLYIILNTFGARLSLTDSEGMLGTEVLGSSVSFSALMTRANRNIRTSLQQIPPVWQKRPIWPTDLTAAAQNDPAGLSRSQESWRSGRLLTDSDELLPILPVRTFNLQGHTGHKWRFTTDVYRNFDKRSFFCL